MLSTFRIGLTALAASSLFAAFLSTAQAQLIRKGNDRPATPATPAAPGAAAPGAATPAIPGPGEPAGQARREGRQEAREARQEARASGETRPEARQAARDTRQGSRQNIQATRAADLGLWFNNRAADGLVIADLTDNGMFATAGFREGDRIVSINGQPITTEAQFVQFLTGPNIGTQPVQIVVIRGGQQQTLVLQPTVLTQGIVSHDPLYQYGIVIDDRNPNQIVVLRVFPRTPAFYAGLRTGDVITTLGGQRITSVDMLTQTLVNADAAVPLQVTRSGQTRDLQLDASLGADSSVRTALRPDLDAAARGDAQLDTRRPDSDRAAPRTPDSNVTQPRTPDTGAPTTPRAAPTTPATPQAAPTAPGTTPRTGAGAPTAPSAPGAPTQPRTGGQPSPTPSPAPAPRTGGQPSPTPSPAPGAPRAGGQAPGGQASPQPNPTPAPTNPR